MAGTRLVSIVDDDESIRQALVSLLRSAGIEAAAFASGEEFLRSRRVADTACVILDLQMADMAGLEVQTRLRREGHRIPIVILTAHGDDEARERALSLGAVAFLSKPADGDDLLGAVSSALRTR
jgi:FixJ family two-component response regulator